MSHHESQQPIKLNVSDLCVARRKLVGRADGNSPFADIRELQRAIISFKMRHRRRRVSFQELYNIMTELGYRKVAG